MNQSKDQTQKMKDTAIRIHQHQAPFSTEQDGDFTRKIYVSKSECYDKRFTFRSQNAMTNTSFPRTFIVLAPRNGLVQDPEKTIFRIQKDVHPVLKTVPSGKRLHSYGKSLCLMGKSTINGNFQ